MSTLRAMMALVKYMTERQLNGAIDFDISNEHTYNEKALTLDNQFKVSNIIKGDVF